MNNQDPKKILIIEDEKPMAVILQLKLKKAGFDPHVVYEGESALSELASGSYHLALLDLMMPQVDGWSVLARVKEMHIKTVMIVTSNLGQEEDRKRAIELGAVDYLVKANTPLTVIVEKVTALLSLPSATQ